MLSDALPPLDLEYPMSTNTSLGLQCAGYLREVAQNVVAQKVRRGSKRDQVTEQNNVMLTCLESQCLKTKNPPQNILLHSSAWVLILGKDYLHNSR